MILKEKYKPYDSVTVLDHFECYYQKYLQSKLKNEKVFISDFMKSLDFVDIEMIISKYHKDDSKKEKEFIEYVDSSSNFYHLVDNKLKPIENNYDKVSKELSYPSRIVYFVNQSFLFEELLSRKFNLKHTESFYKWLLHGLNQRIISNRNLLFNYIEGLKNFDVKDAISAYMVLERNEAKNIFGKAMISNSPSLKLNFEIILENWTIIFKEERFIPHIHIFMNYDLEHRKVFKIEKIHLNEFSKRLVSYNFPDSPFIQVHLFNISDKKKEVLFINILKDLFAQIDKTISKKEVDIFYYSLTQVNPWKFSNAEMVQTRKKINDRFIECNRINCDSKTANRLLCAFIYKLKVNKFITAKSFTNALEEYFVQEVQLSESTFDTYVYRDSESSNNYEDYKDIIEKIAPISILGIKNTRVKPTALK